MPVPPKLASLSLKSQREGKVIYAYDWNAKTYFEVSGLRIKRISKDQYLEAQPQKNHPLN